MEELFLQLGVNWRLLLSQGVNFLILLLALIFLVYKPLLKTMEERRRRIESGLMNADEAERKLKEIKSVESEHIAKAEKSALGVIKKAEDDARVSAKTIIAVAEARATGFLDEAREVVSKKRTEELIKLGGEATALIKEAIAVAVRLDPKLIDERLIRESAKAIKNKI